MAIDFTAGIQRFAGRRARYLDHVREAIVSIPETLERIKSEIDSRSAREAEFITHALRGRVGALGMTSMVDRLQDLETALHSQKHVGTCLVAAEAEFLRTKHDVASLLASDRPIEWQDAYSVGVPEIDIQHQGLFALIAQIAATEQPSAEYLHEMLSRLANYALTHFDAEEQFLRARGCPDITSHAEEHTHFVSRIATTSLNAMHGSIDRDRLLDFLGTWLIDHILGIDQPHLRHYRGSR